MLVYDHLDHNEFPAREQEFVPGWAPSVLKQHDAVKEYADRARNIVRHVGYQARGKASGVHGLLHQ